MKMNKMLAGLIAFVAGVALSAGSAFATNGYVTGDHARMKLVPYFETGENRATIIGIQNLSMQEMATTTAKNLVRDIKNYLDGKAATAAAVTAINAEGASISADDVLPDDDLNLKAQAADALEKAEMADYDEHVFVTVTAYDAMGMMEEDVKPVSLCLKAHEFGVVVLQGPTDDMGSDRVLSVQDGDLSEDGYGYVKIMAEDRKFQSCTGTPRQGLKPVVTGDGTDTDMVTMAKSYIAAWTIIQDVGMGFFGTEVPTSTISMETNPGATEASTDDDKGMETACYSTPTTFTADTANYTGGAFRQSRCGLIPERHVMGALNVATTTNNANALVRYDVMDETAVVVWLAAGQDTAKTSPRDARMLDVVVKCEDGEVKTGMDRYGDPTTAIKVPAPNMITMIDPMGEQLGPYTEECADAGFSRGVLRITMPDGSRAGMAFSHITQMGGHYRMNFPGYSKAAPDDVCTTDSDMMCQ